MFRQKFYLKRTTSFLTIAVTLLPMASSCFAPAVFSCPIDFTEGQIANIEGVMSCAQTSQGQPAALQKNESPLLLALIFSQKNRGRSNGVYQPTICEISIYSDGLLGAVPFHLSEAPYASDLSSGLSIKTTRKRE